MVGIVIVTIAALHAHSVVLAGFGLDSLIEIGSSGDDTINAATPKLKPRRWCVQLNQGIAVAIPTSSPTGPL